MKTAQILLMAINRFQDQKEIYAVPVLTELAQKIDPVADPSLIFGEAGLEALMLYDDARSNYMWDQKMRRWPTNISERIWIARQAYKQASLRDQV